MRWDDSDFRKLTEKVIGCFFEVHNQLGPGFLELAYSRSLTKELMLNFSLVEPEREFPVMYKGDIVSSYKPDIVVENSVIIEVKAVREINEHHIAQLLAQLRATEIIIGFLVNFSKKSLEFKRYDNFYLLEKKGLLLFD